MVGREAGAVQGTSLHLSCLRLRILYHVLGIPNLTTARWLTLADWRSRLLQNTCTVKPCEKTALTAGWPLQIARGIFRVDFHFPPKRLTDLDLNFRHICVWQPEANYEPEITSVDWGLLLLKEEDAGVQHTLIWGHKEFGFPSHWDRPCLTHFTGPGCLVGTCCFFSLSLKISWDNLSNACLQMKGKRKQWATNALTQNINVN